MREIKYRAFKLDFYSLADVERYAREKLKEGYGEAVYLNGNYLHSYLKLNGVLKTYKEKI